MGQKIGKAELIEEVEPFTNLPRRAIAHIWQAFNNVADGFGVSSDELEEICCDLKDELNISRISILEKTSALFKAYDTDRNSLIDALEFFASISVISGMKKSEIIEFILTIYDFDGTQTLSLDEVVLALKSVSVGLCKIQTANSNDANNAREKIIVAKEEQIERLVSFLFHSAQSTPATATTGVKSNTQRNTITGAGNGSGAGGGGQTPAAESKQSAVVPSYLVDNDVRLSIKLLVSLLSGHPDVNYWYAYFHAPSQRNMTVYQTRATDCDFECENPVIERSTDDINGIHWNVQCITEKTEYSPTEHPWISPVAMLTPIQYASSGANNNNSKSVTRKDIPDTSMHPEWIYGYQSERVKNNVAYNYQGNLVYTVSKYAIIYNFNDNSQNIFTGHTEEILSFAMHPNKQFVCTGDGGPCPRLLVWHTGTNKIHYASDARLHRDGITHVCFSPDGKLVLSVSNDVNHTLNVISWEVTSPVLLYTCPTNTAAVRACCVLNNNALVVAGDNFIHFWSKASSVSAGGYIKRCGIFSRFSAVQTITAVSPVFNTDNLVTGTVSGQLLLWIDVNCIRNVQAHKGSISSVYSYSHGIISGGKDCRIRMWTPNLEPGFTFDITHFAYNPSVRALCASPDGTSVVFGTRGANIFEISAIDGSDLRGGPVAVGHSYGAVNSVAVHPSKLEFITVGQDKTLRIYEMNTKLQLKVATFDGDAVSVTYSPLGDLIVIGFGTIVYPAGDGHGRGHGMLENGPSKCGAFVVLNEEDLAVIHEAKDSNHAVTAVCFSPEGESLAVGTADGSVYLYSVIDEYELVAKFTKHLKPVISIDFSADGEWIRSNSQDRELCFFNTDDGALQTNIASMRDVVWATNHCMYTWHMKSVHKSPFKTELITAVHTPVSTPEYVACGSSLGYIQLRSFPCVYDDAECLRYPAHCNTVGGVKYTYDVSKFVSFGREDRCVIQWQCFPYNSNNAGGVTGESNINAKNVRSEGDKSEDLLLEARAGDAQLKAEFLHEKSTFSVGVINGLQSGQQELVPTPDNDIWLRDTVEPSVLPTIHTNTPQMSVILEHVYGYESQYLRNNVRYSKGDDSAVYVTSTLGVVMDLSNKSQKIFKYHTDTITSFACTTDGAVVATGQMGHIAKVAVWSSKTCKTLFLLPEPQLYSVSALAFSQSSDYLAVVSNDAMHTISIYNWKANIAVSRFYSGTNHLLGVCFTNSADSQQQLGLVSYGMHELKFWDNVCTKFPTSHKPIFGEVGFMQNFLCCEIFVNCPTIGTADGNLYVFDDGCQLKHAVKCHNGSVHAMHVSPTHILVTGGRDGVVRIWNTNHECIKEYSIDSMITSFNPKVRSVAFSSDGARILIGTRGSEILEITAKDGKLVQSKPLVEFHGNRQLCGMSAHPIREEFATAGDDATIRIWDSKSYVPIKSIKVDTPSRACCYSPDGKYLAVGFGNGKRTKGKLAPKEGAFVILKTADWKIAFEGKDSNHFIRVIRYSPDHKILAIGSEDNCIYIYNAKEQYTKRATLRCHSAPICSLDFNIEGSFLFSSDVAKRFCFSDAESGITIPTPESLRDEKWSTVTAPIGWSVKGFWLMQGDLKIEPWTAQRSWGGLLTAIGNTAGQVTIAHSPTPYKAGFIQCSGHASAVSNIAWVAGDATLLTCGVNDHTVLQWKCIYDTSRESGDEGGRSCEDSGIENDCGHDSQLAHFKRKSNNSTAGNNKAYYVVGGGEAAGLRQIDAQGNTLAVVETGNQQLQTAVQQKWLSTIAPPSNLPVDNLDPLDGNICDLEFIQGARVSDCRNTLKYNSDGNIVYFASSFGVIFDRNTLSQRFYKGHRNAIISLALNSSGDIAVTGDACEKNPEIHLWDARTGLYITHFSNIHTQGVSAVCFSKSCDYLVSMGQDTHNSMVLFYSPSKTWLDGYCVTSTAVSTNQMLWCVYLENNAFPIAVGGAGGVSFYRTVRNTTECQKGTFGKQVKIQPVLCAIAVERTNSTANGETMLVTGTVSGHLYIFTDCKVTQKISAHDTPVYALCKVSAGLVNSGSVGYITASKDGQVKLWSDAFTVLHTYKMNNYFPKPFLPSVSSVAINRTNTSFIIACKSGEVYETTLASHTHVVLIESHSLSEVHALAVNPTNADEYVTVGDDGIVRLWSINRKYCLCKAFIEFPSRAVAWSNNGDRIVVGIGTGSATASGAGAAGGRSGPAGSKDGAFVVLNAVNLEIVREDRKAKQYITDIKYSTTASSDLVAFASGDGRVYVHESINYALLHTIDTQTTRTTTAAVTVTRVDFSTDNRYLCMSTTAGELLYYSLQDKQFVHSGMTVRDVSWQGSSNNNNSATVPFNWNTQGVFDRSVGSNSFEVIAVAVHDKLLAVSYDCGAIRIYRYPCQNTQAPYVVVPGVATKATRLSFSKDGSHLIVLDSLLRTVLQYKIKQQQMM